VILRKRKKSAVVAGSLVLLAPLTLGGCPEVRNQLVDIAETATRTVIFTDQDPQKTLENVIYGIVDAGIDLVFDQFRSDTNRWN